MFVLISSIRKFTGKFKSNSYCKICRPKISMSKCYSIGCFVFAFYHNDPFGHRWNFYRILIEFSKPTPSNFFFAFGRDIYIRLFRISSAYVGYSPFHGKAYLE